MDGFYLHIDSSQCSVYVGALIFEQGIIHACKILRIKQRLCNVMRLIFLLLTSSEDFQQCCY